MVHQTQDILGHVLAAVGLRVVRLVARAVAAAVQGDDPSHRLEGLHPVGGYPVALQAAGEAVHQNDGLPLAKGLVVNLHAVGIKVP
jgi:hypothetical protein